MKVRYDREDDVLTLLLAEGVVDHAEEVDGVIVHFTKDDRPLLLEMLDASELLAQLNRIAARAPTGEPVQL
jgi:uncharacterized protein YuzE